MNTGNTSNLLAIGIEIGGTKTQVGIGSLDGKLLKPVLRRRVIPEDEADGILRDLRSMVDEALTSTGRSLAEIGKIGIGFGGVLNASQGLVMRSYQVRGWDNFPLQKWAEEQWGKPVVLQNDASTAALAEALHGSGCGFSRVFYMTIGSGIGGGWIVDGRLDNGQGLGSAEIGHTWVPDPQTGQPAELEQICSGWAIGERARLAVSDQSSSMLQMAGSRAAIDARIVYAAAEQGDALAARILLETCQTLALAIGNVIALLHPQRVILGGGVSLMGSLFWDTLRKEAFGRTMPSFRSRVEIVPAQFGEDVVVVGALCL